MEVIIIAGVTLSNFSQSLYLSILFFSYTLNRIWGKNKPDDYLAFIWKYMAPFLFGTIGAAIDLSDLQGDLIPKAILLVL